MKLPATLFLTGYTAKMASAFVQHAVDYATGAHGAQKRKYTGADYVTHCIAVAETVARVTDDAEVIAAAALHDCLEDTPCTFTDILLAFGPRVARLVFEVTDASKPGDGNRATRKLIDLANLAKSSPEGATIKLADIIDNSKDILAHDQTFAKVYLKEKAAALEVLRHGDQTLFNAAEGILEDAITQLSIAA